VTRGPAPLRATALLLAAVGLPGAAAAQYFPAQPAGYLMSATARDGRAVWVNPAALARRPEASVGADVTASFGGGTAHVSQFGATLASHGLAFGWSRTEPRTIGAPTASLPAITTFVLGLGLGDAVFSAGAAKRWYKGSTRSASAWEVGTQFRATRSLEFSLVYRDIGSPAVSAYRGIVPGDTLLPARLIPGVGITLFAGRLRGAVEWEWASSFVTRVTRVGWSLEVTERLTVMGRGDLSERPEERSVALAAQWRTQKLRGTMYGAQQSLGDRQDLGAAVQAYAVPAPARRRR
jgi:hypothetical protein